MHDSLKDIIDNPIVWPGCYDKALLVGSYVYCKNCCRDESEMIQDDIETLDIHVVVINTAEIDSSYLCDHCRAELSPYVD